MAHIKNLHTIYMENLGPSHPIPCMDGWCLQPNQRVLKPYLHAYINTTTPYILNAICDNLEPTKRTAPQPKQSNATSSHTTVVMNQNGEKCCCKLNLKKKKTIHPFLFGN